MEQLALPGLPGTCDIQGTHQTPSRAADNGTARTLSPAFIRSRLAVCGATTSVPAANRAAPTVTRQSSRLRL
ncbi:hypothetical protein APX70_200285 [Pseudomonas syringae pv. maculicola]|uniref:Uncharacterized protein n=1 Tax=Pseudomonas syringae pv. maculicola TaxID=59511 RepID=A0A3M3AL47_PSEYM|nr:hypothetical protein APX70_200285 [Pseudomonas syringae pv. maculicola]